MPAHVQCQTGVRWCEGVEEVLDGGRVGDGGEQLSGDGSLRLGGGAALRNKHDQSNYL